MASSAAPISLVLLFLAFGGCALLGMGGLPPWLMAPLMQLRNAARTPAQEFTDIDRPESVLLQRLNAIDAKREPEAALALHAAIGKMLRSSGAAGSRVVEHFTLARDLALQCTDSDAKLAAHLDLAEALIEDGRSWDAQQELIVAHEVFPDHFTENRVKLNRLHGRSKFEVGDTNSGLKYLQEAEKHAVQADEKLNVALDIGFAHTCLGDVSASLETLHKALEVLQKARKNGPDGGMPSAVHDAFALQVYFRLGEAYHFKRDFSMARAHFAKALDFDKRSPGRAPKYLSAIKEDLAHLEQGIGPELHCPKILKAPWDKTETVVEKVEAQDTNAKASFLLSHQEYDKAEALLLKDLRRYPRPYKSSDAARSLNHLGKLYSNEERGNFVQAAKRFRQALLAALASGGANSDEAKVAYEGLKHVRDALPTHEQKVATAAINHYLDAASAGEQLSLKHDKKETKDCASMQYED